MYTLSFFAEPFNVTLSSFPPESAHLGHSIVRNLPFNPHAAAEESSDISSVPYCVLGYDSIDDSSNISMAASSCTEQGFSSDSSVGQQAPPVVREPKPKKNKRRRCGKCDNCLIPECNKCIYCL